MVLTDEQVKLYYNNPDPRIEDAKKLHKKQVMHVHGKNLIEYLTKFEGLESQSKIDLRKRLTRSNKSLFSDLGRNTDKIFKAKGGSKIYDLPTLKEKEFTSKLDNVSGGLSLSKWIQNYWLDKYWTDENGLILIEHKEGIAYPTYKSILTIRNYKQNGQDIDWVIFEPHKIIKEKDIEYFRVYDDSGDYTFMRNGKDYERLKNSKENKYQFDNPWGYVPAQIVSDLIDPLTEFKKSAINEQIELADEYLRDSSVKTLYKYHHMFPLYWQMLPACQVCGGVGEVPIDGNGSSDHVHNMKCYACNGTGKNYKKDVSDVIWVDPPEDKDQPPLTELAGYTVAPYEPLKMMAEEQQLFRYMIFFSHWGTDISQEQNIKTATEIERNLEPVEDRLNNYADSTELIEKALTDIIGYYYYGEAYKGCSIHYGRNFIIKSTNVLENEYKELKLNNSGLNLLNKKLKEIIHAKYQNDPKNLLINLKLIQIEPLVHNTLSQAKLIAPPDMFNEKLYYNDWLTTKTDDEILKQDIKDLKLELKNFTNENVQEISSDSDEQVVK